MGMFSLSRRRIVLVLALNFTLLGVASRRLLFSSIYSTPAATATTFVRLTPTTQLASVVVHERFKNRRSVLCSDTPLTLDTYNLYLPELTSRKYRLDLMPAGGSVWKECLTEWVPGTWQDAANTQLMQLGNWAKNLDVGPDETPKPGHPQVYYFPGFNWGLGSGTLRLASGLMSSMKYNESVCAAFGTSWSYYDANFCGEKTKHLGSDCYYLEQPQCHGAQSAEHMRKTTKREQWWAYPGTRSTIETRGFARDWITRLNAKAWVQSVERFREMNLPDIYMAIQARYGDKKAVRRHGEMLTVDDYFLTICCYGRDYGINHVFLSSDSQQFIDDISKMTSSTQKIHLFSENCTKSDFVWHWNKHEVRNDRLEDQPDKEKERWILDSKANSMIDLLTDIHGMRNADFVIGTYSSNVGTYLGELRELDGSRPFLSMDDNYFKPPI